MCKVTPVVLHGAVSPVVLHGVVSPVVLHGGVSPEGGGTEWAASGGGGPTKAGERSDGAPPPLSQPRSHVQPGRLALTAVIYMYIYIHVYIHIYIYIYINYIYISVYTAEGEEERGARVPKPRTLEPKP